MRAGARRGGDAIDRWGRDERVDRLAGRRDRRRLALEQGEPEMLGRAVAVLERRLVTLVRPAAVMMMAGRRLVRVVVAGVSVVIGMRAMAALDMDARVMAVLVIAVGVRRVLAVRGLVDVDQSVEARDHEQGQRDRRQAYPGSEFAPAQHAGIILAAPPGHKPVKRRRVGDASGRCGAGAAGAALYLDPVPTGRRMSRSRVQVTSNRRRALRTGTAGRAQERVRRRRLLAGAAAALWMLGFELVPGLHIALHDRLASHDHADAHADADGHGPFRGQVQTGRGDRGDHGHTHGHLHAAGQDDHGPEPAAALESGPAPLDALTPLRAPGRDPGHGAGSLAHRGLAAVDPPPPPRLPDLYPADTSPRPLEPTDAPRPSGPLEVRGRGPPSASA